MDKGEGPITARVEDHHRKFTAREGEGTVINKKKPSTQEYCKAVQTHPNGCGERGNVLPIYRGKVPSRGTSAGGAPPSC